MTRWFRIPALTLLTCAALSACTPPEEKGGPETLPRIRGQHSAEAVALIPRDYRFVEPGTLTVATVAAQLPLMDYAQEGGSLVGIEGDIAQLIADGLGLKLRLVAVAWPDWPLGLSSGKYDAVMANITVTEERKEKYDFSTYRDDQLGIYAASDGKLPEIRQPRDIAGLRVTVGGSTNQSQILDRWNASNVAAGHKAAEPQYYDDAGLARLAVLSGRADVNFGPNAVSAYQARDGRTKKIGSFPGGWPLTAYIATATRKGSGLADAITAAVNAQMRNGDYMRVLERWDLASEAIPKSQTNPPGLPRE